MRAKTKLRLTGLCCFALGFVSCSSTFAFTSRRHQGLFWLLAGVALLFFVLGVNLFRGAEGRIRLARGQSTVPPWIGLVLGPPLGILMAFKNQPEAPLGKSAALGVGFGVVAGGAWLAQRWLLDRLGVPDEFVGSRSLEPPPGS